MHRRTFPAFLLLSTLLLAGCSKPSVSSQPPTPGSSSPATSLAQPAAPLSVYIGGADGTVSALTPDTGAVRWHAQIVDASTTSVAALAEGVVFVSANDPGNHAPRIASLSALRASDGVALWRKTVAGASAIAAVSQGIVYLTFGGDGSASSHPNEIQALRAQDGSALWHTQLAGRGPVQASLSHGTLYVTAFNTLVPSPGYYYDATFVYALNARTGAVYWHQTIGRSNAVVAVTNGQVYLLDSGTDVVCDPKVLHVLSASDGSERWHTAGTLLSLIGVEQELAYVIDVPEGCAAGTYAHGTLYALHTADGSSAWQADVAFGVGVLANGAIYLPAADGSLDAYSARDGSILWRVQGESGRVYVFSGLLYVSIGGLSLDALNPATGTLQWRYQTSDTVWLSTIVKGVLYGVSSSYITSSVWNQAIVALSASTGKLLWRFPIGTSEDSPLVG